jgi:hypothetical protein
LVLEDLREAHWPPPWRPGDVDRVLATLERMWALPAEDLPSAEDVRTIMSGWQQIAADPSAFLGLGIASPRWVSGCVPVLRDAADAVSYRGSAFLHMDVRSDNLCLQGERVVLVDWNWAVRGRPSLTWPAGCRRCGSRAVRCRNRSRPGSAGDVRNPLARVARPIATQLGLTRLRLPPRAHRA